VADPTNSNPAADQTSPATAVVFEKRPRWGPELERQFESEGIRVIECRSLADVTDRSANIRRGVILLDLAFKPADCLKYLGRRLNDGSALPVFVVGSNRLAGLEWSVRDLGATAFFAKTIPGHQMADLCRRQFRLPAAAHNDAVNTEIEQP
jgi:DNA-binding response OmpR family regulator